MGRCPAPAQPLPDLQPPPLEFHPLPSLRGEPRRARFCTAFKLPGWERAQSTGLTSVTLGRRASPALGRSLPPPFPLMQAHPPRVRFLSPPPPLQFDPQSPVNTLTTTSRYSRFSPPSSPIASLPSAPIPSPLSFYSPSPPPPRHVQACVGQLSPMGNGAPLWKLYHCPHRLLHPPPLPAVHNSYVLAAVTFAHTVGCLPSPVQQYHWRTLPALTRMHTSPQRSWFFLDYLSPTFLCNHHQPPDPLVYGTCLLSFALLLRLSEAASVSPADLTGHAIRFKPAKRTQTSYWRPLSDFLGQWAAYLLSHTPQASRPLGVHATQQFLRSLPGALTWHSFRRGGAVTLLHLGVAVPQLFLWGRWRSPASLQPYVEQMAPLLLTPSSVVPLFTPSLQIVNLAAATLWPPILFPCNSASPNPTNPTSAAPSSRDAAPNLPSSALACTSHLRLQPPAAAGPRLHQSETLPRSNAQPADSSSDSSSRLSLHESPPPPGPNTPQHPSGTRTPRVRKRARRTVE